MDAAMFFKIIVLLLRIFLRNGGFIESLIKEKDSDRGAAEAFRGEYKINKGLLIL